MASYILHEVRVHGFNFRPIEDPDGFSLCSVQKRYSHSFHGWVRTWTKRLTLIHAVGCALKTTVVSNILMKKFILRSRHFEHLIKMPLLLDEALF